jgi:hypothetical protein
LALRAQIFVTPITLAIRNSLFAIITNCYLFLLHSN